VTAGPGVTNTVTAVKNAQMAQSPLVLLGGATATILKGRGSLQDIDQLSVIRSSTKWAGTVKKIDQLPGKLARAFDESISGVPGPVFLEIPVDLLYEESVVRSWYAKESGGGRGLAGWATRTYVNWHLDRVFRGNDSLALAPVLRHELDLVGELGGVVRKVRSCQRPVLVIGSQAVTQIPDVERLISAIDRLGMPTFLGGASRGLLGATSPIQFRHKRSVALKEADLVIVAGFPFDFRLGYGRSINREAQIVAANLKMSEMTRNRRADDRFVTHPGEFLVRLADYLGNSTGAWNGWLDTLRRREQDREDEIQAMANDAGVADSVGVHPVSLFRALDKIMGPEAHLVVDGGDFVATGSYIIRPRRPLSWLDPGVFGTLGVGGGFAVGAAVCRPEAEVWLLYGDGSAAFSICEFDTFVRHGLAPIAIVGNDACWSQIAREQVDVLGDDVGTVLNRTDYHEVAEGLGAVGLLLTSPDEIESTLQAALEQSRAGRPVLINVHLTGTDFRKGSISI